MCWAKTRDSPKGCSQNRRRTAAWSRGPARGDVTAKVGVNRVDSVRFLSHYGVASKHTALGTCSALHATPRCSSWQ